MTRQYFNLTDWWFFDVSSYRDIEPMLYNDGGHPLWFSNGYLNVPSEFDILKEIILVGGIATDHIWSIGNPNVDGKLRPIVFNPVGTLSPLRDLPSYGIGLLGTEMMGWGGRRHPFEDEMPYIIFDHEYIIDDCGRGFDFHGHPEGKPGLSIYDARGSGWSDVLVVVQNHGEARIIQEILSGLDVSGSNRFGDPFLRDVISSTTIIVAGEPVYLRGKP